MDLDSVAYLAASIAQKVNYQYTNKNTGQQSEVFKNAKEAKQWLYEETEFEGIDPTEWERSEIIKWLTFKEVKTVADNEITNWIKAAKKFSDNPDIVIKGYLTSSGIKNKDIKGLQDRYQYNRYLNTATDYEGWIPKPRPKYLGQCRDYLLTRYPWIKMSPKKIEADAPVVYFAESKGEKGLLMSKDKDLKQAMNTHYIDMNPKKDEQVLCKSSIIGYIDILERGNVKELVGDGFKLICAQTIKGDASDGYKGVPKVGAVKVMEILASEDTPEGCCKALLDFYEYKYSNGITYKSWDDVEQHRTAQELLIQHMKLAYHERGPKDTLTPIERYLKGEDPVYRHGALQ